MKKLVLIVMALVLVLSTSVAFAATAPEVFVDEQNEFITSHTVDTEAGTVSFTHAYEENVWWWTEMAIFTEDQAAELFPNGVVDVQAAVQAWINAIARVPANNGYNQGRTFGPSTDTEGVGGAYTFTEGETYYAVLLVLLNPNGAEGLGTYKVSSVPYEFTYGTASEPSDDPSDDPSNDPSNDPSDDPSDEVSEAPSDDAGDNGDDPTDTADLSVIAYAAAAITGLGALVVAKRK